MAASKFAVESLQFLVHGLCRASAEKDRQLYLSTFELSFMEESCSRGGWLLSRQQPAPLRVKKSLRPAAHHGSR